MTERAEASAGLEFSHRQHVPTRASLFSSSIDLLTFLIKTHYLVFCDVYAVLFCLFVERFLSVLLNYPTGIIEMLCGEHA